VDGTEPAAVGEICCWQIADGQYDGVYDLVATWTIHRWAGLAAVFVAGFVNLWRTLLVRHKGCGRIIKFATTSPMKQVDRSMLFSQIMFAKKS
jgi:hypothetical protein